MQGKRLVLASTEQLHERVGCFVILSQHNRSCLQISQLEAALFQANGGKEASSIHPLLAPEYLDGGFAALSPPSDYMLNSVPSPKRRRSTVDHDMSGSPKESSTSSYTLATPDLTNDRPASQGRMAVESLLLSEDAAAPEGKKEDEWVGENAAPAMIVRSS